MDFASAPPPAVWNELAVRAGNIFATRTWAECWWDEYGAGAATPYILTDRDQDPRVVVALYRAGRVVRQLRFIGSGPADQLGPACAPEDRDVAADLICRDLLDRQPRDWDVLLVQDVPESHRWQHLLGGAEVRRTPNPSVTLDAAEWEGFLKGKSKNFREQVRRRRRRVERDFSAVFRVADASSLAQDLDSLFALHQLRWGPDAPFATGAERRLHERFARLALEEGWLRLHVLELDGKPAAAMYNFRFGGTEDAYQAGRDPRFDDHSVGFVLYTHAIRDALEAGIGEFRMLRGDESYKSRFATRDDVLQSLAVAGTVRGRAAVTATRLRRTV